MLLSTVHNGSPQRVAPHVWIGRLFYNLSDATSKEFLSPLGIKLYTYNLSTGDFNLSVVPAHGWRRAPVLAVPWTLQLPFSNQNKTCIKFTSAHYAHRIHRRHRSLLSQSRAYKAETSQSHTYTQSPAWEPERRFSQTGMPPFSISSH